MATQSHWQQACTGSKVISVMSFHFGASLPSTIGVRRTACGRLVSNQLSALEFRMVHHNSMVCRNTGGVPHHNHKKKQNGGCHNKGRSTFQSIQCCFDSCCFLLRQVLPSGGGVLEAYKTMGACKQQRTAGASMASAQEQVAGRAKFFRQTDADATRHASHVGMPPFHTHMCSCCTTV